MNSKLTEVLFRSLFSTEKGCSYVGGSGCCHQYHTKCLLNYLKGNKICPCCSTEIILNRCKPAWRSTERKQSKGGFFHRMKKWFVKRHKTINDDDEVEMALRTFAYVRCWLYNEHIEIEEY